MAILVTGASGFIGLNVCETLLGAGRSVVAFSATPVPTGARRRLNDLPGRLVEVVGDVLQPADLARAFDALPIERVVHGAALTPGAGQERAAFRRTAEVNVAGTAGVLEAAQARGIGRLVHLSSGSVYGANAFDQEALDEETPPAPVETYAITKYAGERLALRFGTLHGMSVRAARLGTAFGPWERETGVRETLSAIWQLTELARTGGEAVLPRDGRRDWAYSRDLAAGIVALLDAPAPSHAIYNIGPGASFTAAEWCAKLLRAFPGFRWRIEDSAAANISYHAARDRAPLAVGRAARDLGHAARFGLDAAFDDYLAWLRATAQP